MAVVEFEVELDALVSELALLREKGLLRAAQLKLPTLAAVAGQAGLLADGQALGTTTAETLLRTAVSRLDNGPIREQAELGFGLLPGHRALPPDERRRQATDAYNDETEKPPIKADSYRKGPEKAVLMEVAIELARLPESIAELDDARQQLEERLPTQLSLAINWRERFEAYYRMWSALSGLANDLEAARSLAKDGDTENLDEYAAYALFHYTEFLSHLHDFQRDFGGMWLFSDRQAEETISTAIHDIWLNVPLSERDASWLRMVMIEVEPGEVHSFMVMTEDVHTGMNLRSEWQQWVADSVTNEEDEQSAGVVLRCCRTYMETIDREWYKVADWYREERRGEIAPDPPEGRQS
jgi:hypothetical protein